MAYLIMTTDDFSSTPICIVDDYHNYNDNNGYDWEAYIINDDNTIGDCVATYEMFIEKGMAFYHWTKDMDCEFGYPIVLKKWPNRTFNDDIPKNVKEALNEAKTHDEYYDVFDDFYNDHWIGWLTDDEDFYVYGPYKGDEFSAGYGFLVVE